MDFLVLDAFITSIKEGIPTPVDVFDAAVMMAVTPLSELSISRGGEPVDFPDFLAGVSPEDISRCTGKYALHRI